MAISIVSFSFSRADQPEAWGSTLLDAGFLYRILSPTGLVSKLTDFLSSPSYIIAQSPTQYLWNGMFDCHRAEITVMQFTGHSLPVHQSMTVPRDFTLSHIVSQARLRDFFPELPSECVTSFRCITLEWHVWPGRRSLYNNYENNFDFLSLNSKPLRPVNLKSFIFENRVSVTNIWMTIC